MPYYAICNDSGETVSFASEVPADLREGLVAVEVDGPPDGRPWDARKREYGPRPTRTAPRIDRAKALWPADDSTVPEWARSLALALGVKD